MENTKGELLQTIIENRQRIVDLLEDMISRGATTKDQTCELKIRMAEAKIALAEASLRTA